MCGWIQCLQSLYIDSSDELCAGSRFDEGVFISYKIWMQSTDSEHNSF